VATDPRRRPPRSTRHLNDLTGYLIVAILFLAPIPVGSNRPTFWLIWAAIIGAMLVVHSAAMLWADPGRSMQFLRHRLTMSLGALLLLTPALQLLPLGSQMPNFPASLQPEHLTYSVPATLLGFVRYVTYALLFILVTEVATNGRRIRQMSWAIYAAVVIHAAWGMVSLTMLDEQFQIVREAYSGVATGTFINRNSFATFLGMGQCLGLSLVLNRANRPKMLQSYRRLLDEDRLTSCIIWMSLALVFYTLLQTASRMGLFATLAGCFAVVFVYRIKIRRSILVPLLQSLGLLLVGSLVAVAAFGGRVLERAVFTEMALDTRLELYNQVTQLIRNKPLLGYGLDSFASVFPLVHGPPVSAARTWDHAHSTYLALWTEMGLFAGSIPVIILAVVVIGLVRIIARRGSHFAVPVAALGAIILGAVHSLVDFSLEIQANVFLLVVLSGLGVARMRSGASGTQ
jgi:O-antigen ligase